MAAFNAIDTSCFVQGTGKAKLFKKKGKKELEMIMKEKVSFFDVRGVQKCQFRSVLPPKKTAHPSFFFLLLSSPPIQDIRWSEGSAAEKVRRVQVLVFKKFRRTGAAEITELTLNGKRMNK